MARILIVSFSPIRDDPRVMRQVRLLEQKYDVTIMGFGPAPDAKAAYKQVARAPSSMWRKLRMAWRLLLGNSQAVYWNQPKVADAKGLVDGQKFDLVMANDLTALPLSIELGGVAPVLFDAHEYSPREFEDRWLWKLLLGRYCDSLCRHYLPRVGGMVTVCRGIADEYERNYGVRVGVVHNTPAYQELHASPVAEHSIRLIHHGAAMRSRHLESMVEMMRHLDERFTLDLMLMKSDARYLAALRRKAAGGQRIRFLEPVPMPEICSYVNAYDIGVYILPPNSFNSQHALPNKFFEFIQARLGIAIGPSPEMASLVRKYGCGVVAESFRPEVMAASLQGLCRKKVEAFKLASDRAAHELNFEREGQVLLAEVERLLRARNR